MIIEMRLSMLLFLISILFIAALSGAGAVRAETTSDDMIAADEMSSADGWSYYVEYVMEYYDQYTQEFENSVIVITGYDGEEEVVTVPARINGIRVDAIENMYNERIREVTVSKGITRIDGFAFAGCSELRKVTCIDTVQYIGQYAFQGCVNLSGFYASGDNMYIDSFALSDTAVKVVRLPKEYNYAKGAFPQNTSKSTGWLEYWEKRIFRLLPYEFYNFSVVLFITTEAVVLIAAFYYLKRFFEFILSKAGKKTQYDYRVYCRKNRDYLKPDPADHSEYHFQKPKKRSPALYYSSVILLIIIFFVMLMSSMMFITEAFLKSISVGVPKIVQGLILLAFTIITGAVIIFIAYKIFKAYKVRTSADVNKFRVKKFKKGDRRFDS